MNLSILASREFQTVANDNHHHSLKGTLMKLLELEENPIVLADGVSLVKCTENTRIKLNACDIDLTIEEIVEHLNCHV
jgi:hypothetical protein